jgi:hypothetical protein
MNSILRLANRPQAAAWETRRPELTGNNGTTSRGRAPGTAKGTAATQRNATLLQTGAWENVFFNRTNFPRSTTHDGGSSDLQGHGKPQDR